MHLRTNSRLVACAAALLASHAWALPPTEIFTKASPSVWGVKTYDKDGLPLAAGSAVVVAPETLITNCHVLRKASRISLSFENVTIGATLDMWDTVRDICQIKAKNLNAPAVKMGASASLQVGQSVYTIGNPKGLELTLGSGLVSSLRKNDKGQLELVQISAPTSAGSSGGGLFDEQARLVGITTLQIKDGQNLNFAIPVEWVKELPARHLAARSKDEGDLLQGEPKKAEKAAAGTSAAGMAATPVKTWRYQFSEIHGKRREVVIQEKEKEGAVFEEGQVGTSSLPPLQWQANSPIFRTRSAEGIEWPEISPALFQGSMYSRSLRGVPVLGDSFNVDLRYLGDETLFIDGKNYNTTRLEIRGKKEQLPPSGFMLYTFNIKAWYAKELNRVVKVQYRTTLMDYAQTQDKSEMILTSIPAAMKEAK